MAVLRFVSSDEQASQWLALVGLTVQPAVGERVQNLRTRWRETFAGGRCHHRCRGCGPKSLKTGYDWRALETRTEPVSLRELPQLNSLPRTKRGAFLFFEFCKLPVMEYSLQELSGMQKLLNPDISTDLYIVPENLSWTIAITHEQFAYFATSIGRE